jgi:hypothetical protein
MKRNHSNFSRSEYLFFKTPVKNLLQFIYSLNIYLEFMTSNNPVIDFIFIYLFI